MKKQTVFKPAGGVLLLALCCLLRALGQDSRVAQALGMAAGVTGITMLLCFVLGLLHPKAHRARTIVTLANSLLRYAAALVILCWGLSILGVDVSMIVASVGVVALVVGFGVESLIADMVTGTFILFENQYNVGDIVEVGGFRGTVREIGIRTTAISGWNIGNRKDTGWMKAGRAYPLFPTRLWCSSPNRRICRKPEPVLPGLP